MLFNLFNTIVLLGCLQGFIFSGLMYRSQDKRLAERILATLLFLCSLASLHIYLSESNVPWQVGVALSLVPTIIFMAIGPLIYFYTLCLLEPNFDLKGKYKLHFLPVIIDLLPIFCAWFLTIGYMLQYFTQDYLTEWGDIIDKYNSYSDVPRWISVSIYLLLAKNLLTAFNEKLKPHERKKQIQQFRWLSLFLNTFLIFQLLWLAFLIPYIIPSLRSNLLISVGYYPIYIPLSFLIYLLGVKGFLFFRLSTKASSESNIQLTPEQSGKLVKAIVQAMEEDKLYLKPDLDLTQLVNHIGSDQRRVSHVLNTYLLKSFNNFVNYYRIEEVKRKMIAPGNEHLTLTGIAYESGFNSQSTFQRVFKQLTQLSPKEFLQQQKQPK
jgi:AraC-like DNA-binding protein